MVHQNTAWALSLFIGCVSAFIPSDYSGSTSCRNSHQLKMTAEPYESRRAFMNYVVQSAVVTSGFNLLGSVQPAYALGGGLSRVNAKLSAYGLPAVAKLPDGFVPLLEVYGKGKNRDAMLVQFAHPIDWVVTLPSQDVNGEDGTIQAGEYAKGDTATFYVYTALGKVEVR